MGVIFGLHFEWRMVAFEASELVSFAFSSACLSFQGCSEVALYW